MANVSQAELAVQVARIDALELRVSSLESRVSLGEARGAGVEAAILALQLSENTWGNVLVSLNRISDCLSAVPVSGGDPHTVADLLLQLASGVVPAN